jgi:hypothetical protein
MTDFTQMIRWNANFVRGLAQSVLDRAKTIRSTLTPYGVESAVAAKPAGKVTAKKVTVSKAAKKSKSTPAKSRKTKRTSN